MHTSRRNWLKQIGLATAGFGLSPLPSFSFHDKKVQFKSTVEASPIVLMYNENPYGPSPMTLKAMQTSLVNNNRYHWSTIQELISGIAKKHAVKDEQIILSAGSTELLDLFTRSLTLTKGNFIVANPSYTTWTAKAEMIGLRKITIPLTYEKNYDLNSMLNQINNDTQFVHICNPNNPSGSIIPHNNLVTFIKEVTKKTKVIVDEAYLEYSTEKSLDYLTESTPNLIVVKTFSKIYSLAGARIGYGISNKQTIEQLGSYQTWGNGSIGLTSRIAALTSLNDTEFIKTCFTKNAAVRLYTIEQLTKLNIKCVPSHSNFIYFSLVNYPSDYFERIKKGNILAPGIYEEEGKWTRITLGTAEEMHQFIEALK